MYEKNKFIITTEFNKKRLDAFLALQYPDYSRTYFQKLIKEGFVLLNSKATNSGQKLKIGDEVLVELKDFNVLTQIKPENIELDIGMVKDDIKKKKKVHAIVLMENILTSTIELSGENPNKKEKIKALYKEIKIARFPGNLYAGRSHLPSVLDRIGCIIKRPAVSA